MGWTGRNNFGDDLLLDVWQRAFRPRKLIVAPWTRKEQLARIASGAPRVPWVLLGGGTVLGSPYWSQACMRSLQQLHASRVVAIGCGARTATDSGAPGIDEADWSGWGPRSRIEIRGVRGPLSQEAAAPVIGRSDVVGDSALLASLQRTALPPKDVIGVSIGQDIDTTSNVVHEKVRSLAATLRKQGNALSFRVFEFRETDRHSSTLLAAALDTHDIVRYSEVGMDATMAQISSCRSVISERLHGAVAAAAMGVRPVSISYQSKCTDFMASIDLRSGVIQPGTLGSSAAHEIVSESLTKSDHWRESVSRLAGRLSEHASQLSQVDC